MQTKFTVGEIAKLHNLPKQTLIFYDKQNVFKPKFIDGKNGYRYYTADQLELLDSILMLKEIGFSLKEIKFFLEERQIDKSLLMLKEQQKRVDMQANRLKNISVKLNHKIDSLNNIAITEDSAFVTTTKSEYFVVEPIDAPYTLLQTDIATKKLLAKAQKENLPYYYQVGVMVPVQNLILGKFEAATFACLPLTKKICGKNILEKTTGVYAKTFHVGDYASTGLAYSNLLNEIKNNGYKPKNYAYEYCVADSFTNASPKEYITEIQIEVEKL